jgi:hypothetical protein
MKICRRASISGVERRFTIDTAGAASTWRA